MEQPEVVVLQASLDSQALRVRWGHKAPPAQLEPLAHRVPQVRLE